MKRNPFYLFFLLLTAFSVFGQRPAPDKFATNNGNLIIQPILHATLVLQWNDKTIYIDPYGGANAFADIDPADMILITDIHGDHLNTKTLEAIQTNHPIVIAPKAVAEKLPENMKHNLVVLNNGAITTQLGMKIKAIPMYNLPEAPDAKHTKGRGNGYVLDIGGKNIYISGDTEDITEMRALKNIDIAFVCMNLPYTMDVNQAASAVLEFQPKIVYPYHYRGRPDMSDTQKFKSLVEAKNKTIEVRLRNWYPEY